MSNPTVPAYEIADLDLGHDDEGPVGATLISARIGNPRGAVLHVHGFNDYFFHDEYALWWNARGYDFHAVDLRKYGRSLRPHQTPFHVTDLRTYVADLEAALDRIGRIDRPDGPFLLSGHSTGGLVGSLWLADRPEVADGLVLNSPWLDLRGSRFDRTVGTAVIDVVGARDPYRVMPRNAPRVYGESLHRDFSGEWEFDTGWKSIDPRPIHFGWLRAVRRGHAEVRRGLGLPMPVLVLCSERTVQPRGLDEEALSTDVVLDVAQIRGRAPRLGDHVTVAPIPGALHDVVLSRRPVREQAYAVLDRWMTAYVEG